MKFTEGYWLYSEKSNGLFAMCAHYITPIPGGMRVVAPTKVIQSRGDTLNLPTITIEFTSPAKNVIRVKAWHFEAYINQEAKFDITDDPQDVKLDIGEEEATMTAGDVTVRVFKNPFGYQFEAGGKVITGSYFRNLGYMRWDKKPSTHFCAENYMKQDYQPYMVNELSLQPGECVYGLGERFTSFVKNGQVVDTWNEDGGTASQISYKTVPFYMTNKGYGVLVENTNNVSFEVASEKVENISFSVPGEEIVYDFIYGPTPKDILVSYTNMTGKPALPPAWSFGLWLSTSFTTNYDEETVTSFIDGMKERDIPMSVFHFDCFWMKEFQWCDFVWDERTFPDVENMLRRYKEKGLKLCCWINPYIAQGTALFKEAVEGGYLIRRKDGKGFYQTDLWQNGMGYVDFTNPAAVAWYKGKLKGILDMGIDCFKTDFGERIPTDVEYYDGTDAFSMHNYYTYLYNKCVFELLEEEKGMGEAVLFARSATVGGQKFPVHWGGDCSATYISMAETVRGGLSFAMSGFSFWSHDISGFESTASPDVYKRWLQFGLLSSHSRLHGSGSYRVPWLFGEESVDVARSFSKLKNSLMPYLFDMAVVAHKTGVPTMRPMIMEFPCDPAVNYLDMQYMLGESLLVAPIFNKEGDADYYLPEGTWVHLLSNEVREGGKWYHDNYDFFSLPLYVRENTILAVGACDQKPDYDYAKDVTLKIYSLKEGATAKCEVTDTKGEVVMTACAQLCGDEVVVTIDGRNDGVKVELVNMPGKTAVIK